MTFLVFHDLYEPCVYTIDCVTGLTLKQGEGRQYFAETST